MIKGLHCYQTTGYAAQHVADILYMIAPYEWMVDRHRQLQDLCLALQKKLHTTLAVIYHFISNIQNQKVYFFCPPPSLNKYKKRSLKKWIGGNQSFSSINHSFDLFGLLEVSNNCMKHRKHKNLFCFLIHLKWL